MTCKHCGKEIIERGFDWVHAQPPNRYRCTNGPSQDPQKYAEPQEAGK